MRLIGLVTGLANAEEATELARERRSSEKASRSGLEPETRLDFHLVDIVEMWEPMRETPFIDMLSDRRFSGMGMSMHVSVRS